MVRCKGMEEVLEMLRRTDGMSLLDKVKDHGRAQVLQPAASHRSFPRKICPALLVTQA